MFQLLHLSELFRHWCPATALTCFSRDCTVERFLAVTSEVSNDFVNDDFTPPIPPVTTVPTMRS